MRLSKKIVLFLLIGTVALVVSSSIIFTAFFHSYLTTQESIQTDKDTYRLIDSIEAKKDDYQGSVNDWAHWDETYDYILDKDPLYEQNNLISDTFINLTINFLVFYSKKDGIKSATYYDFEKQAITVFPSEFKNHMNDYLNSIEKNVDDSFIMSFGGDFYWLAVSPITDSVSIKSTDGSILFGKKLDSATILELDKVADGKVQFHTAEELSTYQNGMFDTSGGSNPQYKNWKENTSESEMISWISLPETNIDDFVTPVFVSITKDRLLYINGVKQERNLMFFYIGFSLLVGIILVILIHVTFSKPLFNTTTKISSIDLSKRNFDLLPVKGTDEISRLQIAVNNMLVEIEEKNNELRQNEERLKIIFDQAPIGIALSDIDKKCFIQLNKSFADILQRSSEEIMAEDWLSITHPDDLQEDLNYMELLVSGQIDIFNMDKRFLLPNGFYVWVSMTVAAIKEDYGGIRRNICMIKDITDQKNKEKSIIYLSYHDSLTEIHNRNYFEKMKATLNNENGSLPLTIIMCDINGLKMMNDGFGHHYGDLLLIKAAKMLQKECRPTDVLCRIGGDEFCILLPNTTSEYAEQLCNRVHENCKKQNRLPDREIFHLSISLGFATKTNDTESIELTINIAEDRMQRAKLLNRKSNHLLFLDSMSQVLFEKNLESLEHINRLCNLTRSIQPIFNLSDNDLYSLILLANIHDIGKIAIDETIINKQTNLLSSDWYEIKKHPDIGYRISMVIPEFIPISELVLSHHEQWDGEGYPQNLAGNDIPKLARIFSILEAYDDICQNDIKTNSKKKALSYIKKNAGSKFDPALVELFIYWSDLYTL